METIFTLIKKKKNDACEYTFIPPVSKINPSQLYKSVSSKPKVIYETNSICSLQGDMLLLNWGLKTPSSADSAD